MTGASLQTQWAVCGIAAAAARFVPVPLLDDVVRRRAAQIAVVRTLRAHSRDATAEVSALWDEPEAARRGLRGRLRSVPGRLLLFPVRKYTAVFGAVRGVPDDVARVVLLARAVDRRLDQGGLSAGPELPAEAEALRRAVDRTIDEMDLQLLTAGLADGLSRSRGSARAAVAFARRRLTGDEPDAGLDADGPLTEDAQRVTDVLRRPEVSRLLERFDAQVDDRLAQRG